MTSSTLLRAGGNASVVENGELLVEGIPSTRAVRLFLEGVSVRTNARRSWRLEPRSRTLDDPLYSGEPLGAGRPRLPTQALGAVDVSIERDTERQRSFERAREAAEQFREGTASISREYFNELARLQPGGTCSARELREHQVRAALHALTAANAPELQRSRGC